MTDIELIKVAQTSIVDEKDVGKAISLLSQISEQIGYGPYRPLLASVINDYNLMKHFMLEGYKDPEREKLYFSLLTRLYNICNDCKIAVLVKRNGAYMQAQSSYQSISLTSDDIRTRLEAFVQDTAMLSLQTENSDQHKNKLYADHQKYVARLFDAVLVSPVWSHDVATFAEKTILSPTIDINDALIITSAIMLAAMATTDIEKWKVLLNVYREAKDVRLRERALVGWVFALPDTGSSFFSEIRQCVSEVCADEHCRNELKELQIQIFYCLNAERDNADIQRDIMPTLMKNNNLQISRLGIVEKEEDPMQDILNPDAAEKAMEEVENSMRKMIDMQKQGADIYFGGFSQMKRFPFFYTLSNWFCPFYIEHPQLQPTRDSMKDVGFLDVLFSHGPFCDSDKYSFALAMSSVIDKLPANVREMLGNAEAVSPMHTDFDKQSETYVRRVYLQDLYRFYRLYAFKNEFRNPFDKPNSLFLTNEMFADVSLSGEIMQVVSFLMKRKQYADAAELMRTQDVTDNADALILRATLSQHLADPAAAKDDFIAAATLIEKNKAAIMDDLSDEAALLAAKEKRILKGLAMATFRMGDFKSATDYYSRLLEHDPDNQTFLLNLCVSQINNGDVETGVNGLYKLYYKYPENLTVCRALAWGLMDLQKPQQAINIYSKMLIKGKLSGVDNLNVGYCAWFNGDISVAHDYFRKYLYRTKAAEKREKILSDFMKDKRLLEKNGISEAEMKIMADLALIKEDEDK